MTFQVLLFAQLRELAGSATISVSANAQTAAQLLTAIAEQWPALAPALASSRLAVNQAYAQAETAIAPSDELALIPPVNGG
jgi:molybdopterin converting factor subunit 1